jgi:hypothetical protein
LLYGGLWYQSAACALAVVSDIFALSAACRFALAVWCQTPASFAVVPDTLSFWQVKTQKRLEIMLIFL